MRIKSRMGVALAAILSVQCGESTDEEPTDPKPGGSGGGAGLAEPHAGTGGAGGATVDPCPEMRPMSATTCSVSSDWVCHYIGEHCRCFTPDFTHQPPLWDCVTVASGGSGS